MKKLYKVQLKTPWGEAFWLYPGDQVKASPTQIQITRKNGKVDLLKAKLQ